jgi:predicted phosphoribosyltransferase
MNPPPRPPPPAGHARFRDRREAGRLLGLELAGLAIEDPQVAALPRGGVPVGYEVAIALSAPLDIGLVRKLGAPMNPELGIGAIGEDGAAVVDPVAIDRLGIRDDQLDAVIAAELRELQRRKDRYRAGNPPLDVTGRTVIVVDDGIATGVTAAAAARAIRARGAGRLILAVPVAPAERTGAFRADFDEFVCLRPIEHPFMGVGSAYEDFAQISDDEVVELLAQARLRER